MSFVRNGCVVLLLFCGIIVVNCQMDVSLKNPEPEPYKGLPEVSDPNSSPVDSTPNSGDIFKFNDINDDLRKIGEQIDTQINKHLNILRQENILSNLFNEQGFRQIPKGVPDFDPSGRDSDEGNPLVDFIKFVDDSLPDSYSGSRVSSYPRLDINQQASTGSEENEPLHVYTIIKINDDDNFVPFKNDVSSGDDVSKNDSRNAYLEEQSLQGFLKSFVDAMKDMVDLVKNSATIHVGEIGNKTDQPVDIKIKDHGRTYEIPPDAYLERSDPDMVNITWRSGKDSLNNSLCMKLNKDKDGSIVFHHIRLRILEENGIKEYNREDSVRLEQNQSNSTEVDIADGVGLKIPNPGSLDVVLIEKREKFSAQWMAVSIALLGLIVAGLVLMLSYIIHTRNRYNSRKDSMFKEPIA